MRRPRERGRNTRPRRTWSTQACCRRWRFRDPALEQQRREDGSRPEHGVGVRSALLKERLPAEDQAEQVDRIEAGEAGLPEADLAQLPFPRAAGVVVRQHKAGEHDEEADGEIAGVDHRRQRAKARRVAKMEEDDVQGRETAQACQCVEPGWLSASTFRPTSTCI
jgi:hypothetical protein